MDIEERPVATARLTWRAMAAAIGEAGRCATSFAAEHGMPPAKREALALAVSEAVTNAVRHAYPEDATGEVLLTLATDGEWLTAVVEDRGRGTAAVGRGRGLPRMTALADRIEIGAAPAGAGTRVLMEFPVAPRSGDGEQGPDPPACVPPIGGHP